MKETEKKIIKQNILTIPDMIRPDYSYWYKDSRLNAKTQIYNWDKLILKWIEAPTSTPSYIWQQFVDTVAKKIYFATGTASSSDRTIVN